MSKHARILTLIAAIAAPLSVAVVSGCDGSPSRAARPSIAAELDGLERYADLRRMPHDQEARERFSIRNR